MAAFQTLNPATGEVVATFDPATDDEVAAALENADSAYRTWRETDLAERVAIVKRIAQQYRDRAQELAELIALEMGKPVPQALGEIGISADIYDYYADNAEAFLAPQELEVPDGRAKLLTQPVGVLLGVMPWNYPHYQVARFAAPNLILGNTILMKHASNCPQAALAIQEMVDAAGLPAGAYVNLFATHDQLSTVIADRRVQGISLTGSERAGAIVAEQAGRHLKKVVLELGGSDPFIVLDDENLEATVKAAVHGRLSNCGQACTSPKRYIVLDDVYDRFRDMATQMYRGYAYGDPREKGTRLGPVSSEGAREDLLEQIKDAVDNGATLLAGGEPSEDGFFLAPTLLADLNEDCRLYREEAFGPVGSLFRAKDVDDAIAIANDSPYGLGSAVFGTDPEQLQYVAERLEVGMVTLNGNSDSAPYLPFGGVKLSGFGRELGALGIEEFANRKLVRDVD